MSLTTTSVPATSSVIHILGDYELHHSGTSNSTNETTSVGALGNPALGSPNPAGWPTDYRGIPQYRAINRHLDMEERPGGLDPIETIFITTMLNGVRLNAILNSAWLATGGKFSAKLFFYKIGGEW